MNEKQDYIRRIFAKAMAAGLLTKQYEFAELLGMERSTISAALNGNERALTDSLLNRVRLFAKAHGFDDEGQTIEQTPAAPQGAGFWVSEEFRKTMENMSETIRIQAQIISDLQGSTKVDGYVINPKKKTFIADGDK